MSTLGRLACRVGLHSNYPRQSGRWYVNGRCTRCGAGLRDSPRFGTADTPEGAGERLADCTNYLEDEDRPCDGTLTFRLGDLQAACDSCGAWCGSMVANYRPTPTAGGKVERADTQPEGAGEARFMWHRLVEAMSTTLGCDVLAWRDHETGERSATCQTCGAEVNEDGCTFAQKLATAADQLLRPTPTAGGKVDTAPESGEGR